MSSETGEIIFDVEGGFDAATRALPPRTQTIKRNDSWTTHPLKTWPEQFQAVVDGKKTFEVRHDDRGYQVGDELILREYNPPVDNGCKIPSCELCELEATLTGKGYTGRYARVRVTYVLRGGVPPVDNTLKAGAVVMGFVVSEVRA